MIILMLIPFLFLVWIVLFPLGGYDYLNENIFFIIKNKLYNWKWGVKPYNKKGCVNCGVNKFGDIVKYDWNKPIQFTTRKIKL